LKIGAHWGARGWLTRGDPRAIGGERVHIGVHDHPIANDVAAECHVTLEILVSRGGHDEARNAGHDHCRDQKAIQAFANLIAPTIRRRLVQ
jgi:hypothetical protein